MSDLLVKNIVATIGGPESTPGTAESREYVLPIRGMPTLKQAADKMEDPVITGRNMSAGEFTVAKNVAGDFPISPRCCGGMGQIINSVLGQEGTPTQIAACIRVRFTGSEASCDIIAETSGDTFSAQTGDVGSETDDAEWGGGSAIDLTAGATDTVGELVSVINAYTDFDCEKVFGADATDAADIVAITTAQAKNRWVYVFFSSAASGYYLHKWPVVLTNTLRPVYSVQVDGMHDDRLFDGVAGRQLSLSAALKSIMEGTWQTLGFEETTDGVTASALTLEDVDPLIFSQGSVSIGADEFTYVRKVDVTMQNTMGENGFGMGSLYRQYHRVPTFGLTGSMTIRYDATIYGYRSNVFDDSVAGVSFYFKANTDFATDIPQIMIVDIPYAQLRRLEETENDGVMDVQLELLGTNPSGAYSDPLTVYMITDDSGAY